jgi:hypothetical protein
VKDLILWRESLQSDFELGTKESHQTWEKERERRGMRWSSCVMS